MGMRIERALRLRDECRDNLRGLFSYAVAFRVTHDFMLEERNRFYEKLAKAPHWVKSYLDGYWQAKQDELYRGHLVYGAWLDGTFYSTHRNRDDYYEKQGMEPSIFAEKTEGAVTGHYWSHDVARPF